MQTANYTDTLLDTSDRMDCWIVGVDPDHEDDAIRVTSETDRITASGVRNPAPRGVAAITITGPNGSVEFDGINRIEWLRDALTSFLNSEGRQTAAVDQRAA